MGRMPLQGTFDVLDFSAVLDLLAAHNMSGRLHVRGRSFAANLFFSDGMIVGADQSEHQAAAVAGDVPQRVQEICFEFLGADRGNFEFHTGRTSAPAMTMMSVPEAMEQARRRVAEWQELQSLIPSLDVQPHLVSELDPGQVTLDREQWRVLTAVDGRRNLRSIGRALNMSDFEVCRAMRELLVAKVVELDTRPAGMAGFNEVEATLATEQVTINGKRATRLKASHAPAKAGSVADESSEGPTIVISPTRRHREEGSGEPATAPPVSAQSLPSQPSGPSTPATAPQPANAQPERLQPGGAGPRAEWRGTGRPGANPPAPATSGHEGN